MPTLIAPIIMLEKGEIIFMKKAMIFALAAAITLLSACSKDSSSEYVPTETTTEATTIPYVELENPDVRNVMWGMSGPEIAVQETEGNLRACEGGFSVWDVSLAGHDDWEVKYLLTDNKLTSVEYSTSGVDSRALFEHIVEQFDKKYGKHTSYSAMPGPSDLAMGTASWKAPTSNISLKGVENTLDGNVYGRCTVIFEQANNEGVVVNEVEEDTKSYDFKADSSANTKSFKYTVPHGEVLDVYETDELLVIKTKITPSFNNHATISQNFQNLEDLITNQGCSKYSEIQYWAVADMTDGSESKVVSFTAPESTIKGIKDGSIDVIAYLDEYGYLEDVYILPSLKD